LTGSAKAFADLLPEGSFTLRDAIPSSEPGLPVASGSEKSDMYPPNSDYE
jgi:hypothetical protein